MLPGLGDLEGGRVEKEEKEILELEKILKITLPNLLSQVRSQAWIR